MEAMTGNCISFVCLSNQQLYCSNYQGFRFTPIQLRDIYSNGSGKTTLAMSILWALTGSLDSRPMQDSKVSDVVHQESKVK
jgi:hypothetical protein